MRFFLFAGNQNNIETVHEIESLESNEIRPTTAQWLRTLITSVSRPTTTSTASPPSIETEEDDNTAIIDLNETATASTSDNSISEASTTTSIENQFSSNYTPSFYQTTRPPRRHLFSRVRTRTRVNRPERILPHSASRTSTPFSVRSSGLDETIINIETLENAEERDFCAVIDTTDNFQREERVDPDEDSNCPPSSSTELSDTPPSACLTLQENNNCSMVRNARRKQSTSSQMRNRVQTPQGNQSQQNRVSRQRREVYQIEDPQS